MNLFSQILGWMALFLGLAAVVTQIVALAYTAAAFGIISLFIKDIRGMGVTGISFGLVAWLMANIFS